MPEKFTADEIEVLASIYYSPPPARMVLEDAGFPRHRQPGWTGSALDFWRVVAEQLDAGTVADGRRRVLSVAAREYPGNEFLARAVRTTSPPPRATSQSASVSAASVSAASVSAARAADPAREADPEWNFFISFTDAEPDRSWAEWIGWMLEEAGHRVHMVSRALAGDRQSMLLQEGILRSRRTLVILSENYLRAPHAQAQWQAAWDNDPQGIERGLIPVRVEECQPEGLLRGIIYIDLVGLSREDAERMLVDEISASLTGRRPRPARPPSFPGRA